MTDEQIAERARTAPVAELPDFIGELAKSSAIAFSRLHAPAPQPRQTDELLKVGEAARRLGVSRTYLYHHDFPFSRRVGRQTVVLRTRASTLHRTEPQPKINIFRGEKQMKGLGNVFERPGSPYWHCHYSLNNKYQASAETLRVHAGSSNHG